MNMQDILDLAKKRNAEILSIVREYDPSIQKIGDITTSRFHLNDNAIRNQRLLEIIKKYKTEFLEIKIKCYLKYLNTKKSDNLEILDCVSESAAQSDYDPFTGII